MLRGTGYVLNPTETKFWYYIVKMLGGNDKWKYFMVLSGVITLLDYACPSGAQALCPPHEVKCNGTNVCIQTRYICDGDKDCVDGEDEENCDVRGSGCGGVSHQTGMNGTIQSLGYPTNYSNMADCQWSIQAPEGYAIIFEFIDQFDLEKARHGQCVYDGVSIFEDDPLTFVGRFCGSLRPAPVIVNGSKAVVEFQSDGQTNGAGFKLMWTAYKDSSSTPENVTQTTNKPTVSTTKTICGERIDLNDGRGQISSPYYEDGHSYPAPLTCRWRITVSPDSLVGLNFEYLDVGSFSGGGCRDGWLEIYDGPQENNSLIGKYCDAILPGGQLSTSNQVLVVLRVSSNDDGRLGFKLGYTEFKKEFTTTTKRPTVPGCDGKPAVITSSFGHLSSPHYDHISVYGDNLYCEWIFVAAPGNVFYFTFEDFELEQSGGCRYDYLSILDTVYVVNQNNSLDKLVNAGSSSNMSSQTLNDVMHSNSSHSNASAFEGSNQDNSTRKFGSESNRMNITTEDLLDVMHSSSNHSNDENEDASNTSTNQSRLTTSESLKEVVKLCGLMLPYDVESSSNKVVIRFHTDDQIGGYGFNMSFTQQLPQAKCLENEFMCGSSQCINTTSVCDGQQDCDDGSDEIVCPTSSSNCGQPSGKVVSSRIVGGREAAEGAWPWTVSIVDPNTHEHICGATLILPQWAVTAAHCFDGIYDRKYDGYSIIAGRHELRHASPHEQERAISDVIRRRDYVSRTSENDIALVRLQETFNMTDFVNIACLPAQQVPEETMCYITGWGETLNTCCAGRLKQASVPIMNSTLCGSAGYYGSRFMDHMMCAGYPEGGVDSCGGDSGGPLVCEAGDASGDKRWELQGVTSWGVLCASPQSPGVYIIVHDYIEWIQQTIASNLP